MENNRIPIITTYFQYLLEGLVQCGVRHQEGKEGEAWSEGEEEEKGKKK